MRAEYEKRLGGFEVETAREKERQLARQRRLLDDARREIENTVRAIRESQASHEAIVRAKRAVAEHLRRVEQDSAPEPVTGPVPDLAEGDTVDSRTLRAAWPRRSGEWQGGDGRVRQRADAPAGRGP